MRFQHTSLDLRHVQSLGHHAASVGQEKHDHWVELKDGARHDGAVGDTLLNPALGQPERSQSHDSQARRDRKSLEVLCLAVGVLRHVVGGHVEASEACEAGQDEAGEEELVKTGAEAGSERAHGGSDAEGDLVVIVSILVLASHSMPSHCP